MTWKEEDNKRRAQTRRKTRGCKTRFQKTKCVFLNFPDISFFIVVSFAQASFLFPEKSSCFQISFWAFSFSLRKIFIFEKYFLWLFFKTAFFFIILPFLFEEKSCWNAFWEEGNPIVCLFESVLLSTLFLKKSFSTSLKHLLFDQFPFSLFYSGYYSCVFFFTFKIFIKWRDDLIERMYRGQDHWQLTVHGLNSLSNVTARDCDQESFQSRKQSSTHEKKVVSLGNKKNDLFFQILFRKRIILFRKNFRWRWQTPCCPSFTPGT